ncbi:MAG: cytochrome c biogenesis heme-transporting ATPase CcmA [Aquabacterium sp.]|nr:cytochrome c biogenesis heme-transporting ATPase CcmA [Aquabacterium sp.]
MATATTIDSQLCLLNAQDLACRRGERLLFQHLNLSIQAGQAIWVRGPNGRGKTSLLRLLAGLSQAAQGRITTSTRLVYLGHQHALKDDLTALEALAFLVRLHDDAADEASMVQALDRMGIKARRHALVRTLSQGQRRRVALARLALSPPGSLWILDEPFDALDDQGVATLNTLIHDHRQSGGSVILTSHQAANLPELVDLHLDAPGKG